MTQEAIRSIISQIRNNGEPDIELSNKMSVEDALQLIIVNINAELQGDWMANFESISQFYMIEQFSQEVLNRIMDYTPNNRQEAIHSIIFQIQNNRGPDIELFNKMSVEDALKLKILNVNDELQGDWMDNFESVSEFFVIEQNSQYLVPFEAKDMMSRTVLILRFLHDVYQIVNLSSTVWKLRFLHNFNLIVVMLREGRFHEDLKTELDVLYYMCDILKLPYPICLRAVINSIVSQIRNKRGPDIELFNKMSVEDALKMKILNVNDELQGDWLDNFENVSEFFAIEHNSQYLVPFEAKDMSNLSPTVLKLRFLHNFNLIRNCNLIVDMFQESRFHENLTLYYMCDILKLPYPTC